MMTTDICGDMRQVDDFLTLFLHWTLYSHSTHTNTHAALHEGCLDGTVNAEGEETTLIHLSNCGG